MKVLDNETQKRLDIFLFLLLIVIVMFKMHTINHNPENALINRQKWSH